MKNIIMLTVSMLLFLVACKTAGSKSLSKKEMSQADKVFAKALAAHGGDRYETAHYEFVFRKKKYTFKNNQQTYNYTVSSDRNGKEVVDQLNNEGLFRTIDGEKVMLSEKEVRGYTGALNSVIYFATLPHKLQDPAVNKSYEGSTNIKDKKYEILAVTFQEEGGGQDHDDEFLYWINQETGVIDYLAYNYRVNKGGVRFRSAYDPRVVGGVLFQNYVNYKAPVGTPLADLPALFEQDKLEKLSLIETEAVVQLRDRE